MNNEKYAALIADYLKGTLDAEGKKEVEKLIANGTIDLIDIKANEQLYDELSTLQTPEPSKAQAQRFYSMLEQETQKQIAPSPFAWIRELSNQISAMLTAPRMAYSLGVFLMGAFIGGFLQNNSEQVDQLSTEVQQMREVMMITMLERPSATDRLKAVNISNQLVDADQEVVTALLKTLNTDPNVNVRQQAIDALLPWGDKAEVRVGLINAIGNQTSPLVLIALADAMIELNEQRSKEQFQKLLDENEFAPVIKQKLENTIAAIS